MKRIFLLAILILLELNVYAYDNEKVHQHINENATLQSSKFISSMKAAGFKGDSPREVIELNQINGKKIKDWFHEGAKLEDETVCRSRNHFHDPLKPWDNAALNNAAVNAFCFLIGLDKFSVDSSLIWAQKESLDNMWSWPRAREYYYKAFTSPIREDRDRNLAHTFRALSQVMHLVADASVPAHVRNDIHVFPLTVPGIGIEVGGQTYESWAKKNFLRLNYTAYDITLPIFNEAVLNQSAPIPTSALWDQDKYLGKNPEATWATNSIGISEFTNANFFSEDTIFQDYPHPAKVNTNARIIEQIANDGKTDKVWYVKGYTSEKLAACSYLNRWLLPDKWAYNLDSYVYQDYASQLIPRAVGYSAGLLDYFFRGDIDMVPDNSGSGFLIKNNSDEDMNGMFELWYDDANDKRKKAWDGRLSIGRKSRSSNVTFTPPDNMEEDGKYMLVFRGELGKEKDAVIGKEITLVEAISTFFLVTSGDQMVFKFDIDRGKYKIEPIDKELHLEGDKSGFRTWTVVTHPDNTRHYLTWANSYNYLDYIENYGLKTGTYYLWRPEGFEEESNYILTTTGGSNETDLTVSAFGRHNYTLDNEGRMVTYDESIWAKATHGCSNLDYVYRYKNEQSEDNFVDGEVITSDQLGETAVVYIPGQGYTRCSGPTINNTMIAAIGDNKAIYIENKHWPNEGDYTVTERVLEGDYVIEFLTCGQNSDDYYRYHYFHNTMKGTFWLNYGKLHDARKTRLALNVAGEEIEAVEFFPYIAKAEGFLHAGGGWERSSYSWEDIGRASPDCPDIYGSCSVSPETVTFTGLIEQVSTEGATILVHDFDNIPEDDSLIIMYSLSKSVSPSEVTTLEVECELYGGALKELSSQYDAPLWNCKTIGTNIEDATSSKTKKYYVAFKMPSEAAIKKETIYSETVTGEAVYNKILTGFSTQMNKYTIVYTYVMKQWNGTAYEFDKRVVGIINVSDDRLPKGYRQEYIIDAGNFSIEDFDYTQMAGIGIHKF